MINLKLFLFPLCFLFACSSEQNAPPSDLVVTDQLVEQVLELSFYGEQREAFIYDFTSIPFDFIMDSIRVLESDGYTSGEFKSYDNDILSVFSEEEARAKDVFKNGYVGLLFTKYWRKGSSVVFGAHVVGGGDGGNCNLYEFKLIEGRWEYVRTIGCPVVF